MNIEEFLPASVHKLAFLTGKSRQAVWMHVKKAGLAVVGWEHHGNALAAVYGHGPEVPRPAALTNTEKSRRRRAKK